MDNIQVVAEQYVNNVVAIGILKTTASRFEVFYKTNSKGYNIQQSVTIGQGVFTVAYRGITQKYIPRFEFRTKNLNEAVKRFNEMVEAAKIVEFSTKNVKYNGTKSYPKNDVDV